MNRPKAIKSQPKQTKSCLNQRNWPKIMPIMLNGTIVDYGKSPLLKQTPLAAPATSAAAAAAAAEAAAAAASTLTNVSEKKKNLIFNLF